MEVNNNQKTKLYIPVLIFAIAVCIYTAISCFISTPVHIGPDEQLYISLARSFHYDGNFVSGGIAKNYGSILYSMIISVAYYFYSPVYIFKIMRLINVVIMTSAVFPTMGIINTMGIKDKKKCLAVLILSVLIPDVAGSMYMMQEVLLYPVFMWTVYCVLKNIAGNHSDRFMVAIPVMLAVCYFTKTSAIGFASGYFLYLLITGVLCNKTKDIKKRYAVKLISEGAVYAALLLLEKVYISYVNAGLTAENHYMDQIKWLFPIDWTLILQIIVGIIFYIAFTGICMGGGMLLTVCKDIKKDKFGRLLFIMLGVSIIEIVITILCTENRGQILPNKFCFRYLFCMAVPFICCFVKYADNRSDNESISVDRKYLCVWVFEGIVALVYFVLIGTNLHEGITDAFLVMIIGLITNNVLACFGIIAAIIFIIGTVAFYHIANKKNWGFGACYLRIALIYCTGFLMLNAVLLPYYSNQVAEGRQIEADAVILQQEAQGLDAQVYICRGGEGYYPMIGSYLSRDVIMIDSPEDAPVLAEGKTIIVIPREMQMTADYNGSIVNWIIR